ncbi:hypothetical protein RCH14_000959 [Massilia sp. MP_M2]
MQLISAQESQVINFWIDRRDLKLSASDLISPTRFAAIQRVIELSLFHACDQATSSTSGLRHLSYFCTKA